MQIRLDFPPGTIVEPITDTENVLVGVNLTPYFASKRSTATVAKGKSVSARNTTIDEFHLTVSGTTGHLRKQTRTAPVIPFCDRQLGEAYPDTDDDDDNEEEDA